MPVILQLKHPIYAPEHPLILHLLQETTEEREGEKICLLFEKCVFCKSGLEITQPKHVIRLAALEEGKQANAFQQ